MSKISREILEQQLEQKLVKLHIEDCLKGGNGRCYIYKDVTPSAPWESESGKIVIEEGASIGFHYHDVDSETYTVLKGTVEINGKIYHVGDSVICPKGQGHNAINCGFGDAILGFSKVM